MKAHIDLAGYERIGNGHVAGRSDEFGLGRNSAIISGQRKETACLLGVAEKKNKVWP